MGLGQGLGPIPARGGGGGVGGMLVPPGGYFAALGARSASARANNRAETSFVVIDTMMVVDRIGVNVTEAGESGAVARLGIYGPLDPDDPLNGPLLLEAGTQAVDAVGFNPLPINQVLTPGWYALTCCVQSASTTPPTMTSLTASGHGGLFQQFVSAGANFNYPGVGQTGVSGPLPATLPRASGPSTTPTLVALRRKP